MPEKKRPGADAVARRMIASALGVKVPRMTEEQKKYDQAIREKGAAAGRRRGRCRRRKRRGAQGQAGRLGRLNCSYSGWISASIVGFREYIWITPAG